MIKCERCKAKSRVVLTRYLHDHDNIFLIRTRQCTSCRWKWKTIETVYTGKAKDSPMLENAK